MARQNKIKTLKLNKYIAQCGVCSRRKADELILSGVVFVNGKKVENLGEIVTSKDKVVVDGNLIKPDNFVYIRFYKPAGYITSLNDEKGRKTIYDILPEEVKKLKPVGRLDKDTSGLLIMTNDGDFINSLTHPKIKIPKVYKVVVEGKMTRQKVLELEKGIEIENGKIAYAQVDCVDVLSDTTVLQITLYQGLNRQIRKMCQKVGHEVVTLKRIKHANVVLDGLKRGAFKYINQKQIKEIENYIKKIL